VHALFVGDLRSQGPTAPGRRSFPGMA